MLSTRLSISGQRMPDLISRDRQKAERIVQVAVEEGTEHMLQAFRADLSRAFPGSRRAPNLVTSNVFPDWTVSLRAAGTVVARGGKNSPWPAPLRMFNEGGAIYPTLVGTTLAIPTARVPMMARGKQMTPDEVQRHYGEHLTLLKARKGKAWGYLVLYRQTMGKGGAVRRLTKGRAAQGRRAQPIIMFILVPKATFQKRLNFDAIAKGVAATMPNLLERAAQRINGVERF